LNDTAIEPGVKPEVQPAVFNRFKVFEAHQVVMMLSKKSFGLFELLVKGYKWLA